MKITKTFAAIGLAGIMLLNFASFNAFAEWDWRATTTSELPEGTTLVSELPQFNNDVVYNFIYGSETAYSEYANMHSQEGCESDLAYTHCIFDNFYDKYGLIYFNHIVDIHLEDGPDHEIDYNGDAIEITAGLGINYDDNVIPTLEQFSSLQWEPKMLHMKSDGSLEYLPVTINGKLWTFTTDSFSLFAPVAVAIRGEEPEPEPETEPVKTLDSSVYSIDIIAVSLATIATYSVYLKKSRR